MYRAPAPRHDGISRLGFITAESLSAFLQVIMIDLVLAGDNAIVIGMAAAGLAPDLRKRAILVGIGAATILRIVFALLTVQLMSLGGVVLLAGGALLFYVCWKMYRELAHPHAEEHDATNALADELNADGTVAKRAPRKTLRDAVIQIVIADVSMSLDNVLAVAGAAQHHLEALIFGLALSVILMGVASSFIAQLLNKHRWIAWVGLIVILYVAIRMVYEGADQLLGHTLPQIPLLKGAPPAVAVHA